MLYYMLQCSIAYVICYVLGITYYVLDIICYMVYDTLYYVLYHILPYIASSVNGVTKFGNI